ncbi:MAG: hypothetical protein ACOYWZ_11680 [Bacillota bacterium]
MFELLKTAITGVNIIPTTLLGLAVLYWLIVILGAIDIDFLDFDLDVEGDPVTGPFHGILAFLNVSYLPFMLVFSIITLIFWVLSMLMHLLPIETGGLISGILFIPNLVLSVVITGAVTYPLKGLFKDAYKAGNKEDRIEGKLCTLLCDLTFGRLGQAEVKRDGASYVINVKVEEGENLKKGDKALVISKDVEKSFYIVKKFEGVGVER